MSDSHADGRSTASASGRRVLLIDDNEGILQVMAETLRDAGFLVGKALDGFEALELVRGWMPDAIVLDRQMPVMDGDEFFRTLRAQVTDRPILIVSGHDAKGGAAALGADGWLDKPFDIEDLVAHVQALFAPDRESAAASR